MSNIPLLVGHRGCMRTCPENTLLAIETALTEGAPCIEFDLQLSADGVPVLMHDETLTRTTGHEAKVSDLSAAELTRISAHYPERFGDTFHDQPIPTLAQAVTLINRHPEALVFVEAKRQSIKRFGVEGFIDRIVAQMREARFRWVLISFIQDAVEYARRRHGLPIGWVLREHNETSHGIARVMRPDYLFNNITRIGDPRHALWPGVWQWVIYDIVDAEEAMYLYRAGAAFIETADVGALIRDLAVVQA